MTDVLDNIKDLAKNINAMLPYQNSYIRINDANMVIVTTEINNVLINQIINYLNVKYCTIGAYGNEVYIKIWFGDKK